MIKRGICYDVGTFTSKDNSSRPTFDQDVVRREMQIIAQDLHCNAVKVYGQDIERLLFAAECGRAAGLEVWLSPQFHNAGERETLAYLAECARAAESLRKRCERKIVFVAGCELTFFMRGLVLGDDSFARMQTFFKPWRLIKNTILKGPFNTRLNSFLREAAGVIRAEFRGPLTYASGPWEDVDWSVFDFIGVDYYRDARNRQSYADGLSKYGRSGKPVAVLEAGCCTYQGADNKGGYGWAIVDRSQTPRRLKENLARDEALQAACLNELLEVFERAHVYGSFIFTFAMETYPHSADPLFDLDRASYGVVKMLANGKGTTYPDMPWEPKESFAAVAQFYGRTHSGAATADGN